MDTFLVFWLTAGTAAAVLVIAIPENLSEIAIRYKYNLPVWLAKGSTCIVGVIGGPITFLLKARIIYTKMRP